MIRTPNNHFEEIDWLDFVQGAASPEERIRLEIHLTECAACRERLVPLRRLAEALPAAAPFLTGDPELAGVLAPFSTDDDSDSLERVRRAGRDARTRLAQMAACRTELEQRLGAGGLPSAADYPGLSAGHLVAANAIVREFFRIDIERARPILAWAQEALRTPGPGGVILAGDALEGTLRISQAYLTLRDGDASRSLSELDSARALIEREAEIPEEEMAFWSHVRANALHQLSRFDESLEEIGRAEKLYDLLNDWPQRARCQLSAAVVISDSGRPAEAIPIYARLLAESGQITDSRLLALLHLNYAADLVQINRLTDAKSAYARATDLLKKSGQEDQLFRVRVGLADIAEREGRLEYALALNLKLRPEFPSRHLVWDEIQRELVIVNLLLKLNRGYEASRACIGLAPRAEALGLHQEAAAALEHLSSAGCALESQRVEAVRLFLRRARRGSPDPWSAA